MNEKIVEFDMSDEDTCMKHWTFTLMEKRDETIIRSIKIKPSGEGCVGHPKTIMALVRDTPLEALDIERLSTTKCIRTTSCGMSLATCIKEISKRSTQLL